MAADVLGRAVDDQVGPEIDRPQEHRRGYRIIYYQTTPGRTSKLRDRRDIGDLQQWVRDRLEEHHVRRGAADRLLDTIEVGHIAKLDRDTLRAEKVVEQGARRAVQV